GVIDNVVYVGGNGHVTGVDRGVRMTGSHLGNNNVATRPACDVLSVTGEHIKGAATHCTYTTDTYFYRFQGRLPSDREWLSLPHRPGARHKSRYSTLSHRRCPIARKPGNSVGFLSERCLVE